MENNILLFMPPKRYITLFDQVAEQWNKSTVMVHQQKMNKPASHAPLSAIKEVCYKSLLLSR